MTQEEQQGANPPTMRPVVLPEPYNGESSWTDWYEHFESVAAVNRWKDGEKLLWLRVRLVGRAATAFKRVPEPARGSFADCIEALRERFDPSSKRELYLAELFGRKKRRGEDWATIAEDLKTLVDKAYPELQDDAKEQLALTHYLGQLEQQQLAFSVKQRRPKSVDAAVSATLEMESYLVPKGGRVAQVAEDLTSAEPVAAVRDQQDAVISLLQQVVQRMDQLEERVAAMQVGAKSPPPSAEPREFQRTGQGPSRRGLKERGPVVCHRCKKEGHLARGCVAPRNQQGRTTNQGNGKPSV